MKRGKICLLVGICIIVPHLAAAYWPPQYNKTFYGDADGDIVAVFNSQAKKAVSPRRLEKRRPYSNMDRHDLLSDPLLHQSSKISLESILQSVIKC